MNPQKQSKTILEKLNEKKTLIELVVAALTIPVLLTVILLNFSDIKGKKNTPPTSSNSPIIIEKDNGNNSQSDSDKNISQIASPDPENCKEQVGPVSISSPAEGITLSDNPVNFIIKYTDPDYCSVVWSYRINGGTWSEYSSNSPTIYNMPAGPVKFELRVQSTVSSDQELLTRNFVYADNIPDPSPSPETE